MNARTLLLAPALLLFPAACSHVSSLDLSRSERAWEDLERPDRGQAESYRDAVNAIRHGFQHLDGSRDSSCSADEVCTAHDRAVQEGDARPRSCFCVHAVGAHWAKPETWDDSLGVSNLVALPFVGLYDVGKYLFVEDADSIFRTTTFHSLVMFDRPAPSSTLTASVLSESGDTFGLDEEFEIVLRFLAVDNFTEGRLRDEYGGDGGELRLHASLNALAPGGELVDADRSFLVRESVRRRSPLLALLRSTQDGSKVADEVEAFGRRLQEWTGESRHELDKLREDVDRLAQTLSADPAQFQAEVKQLLNDLLSQAIQPRTAAMQQTLNELKNTTGSASLLAGQNDVDAKQLAAAIADLTQMGSVSRGGKSLSTLLNSLDGDVSTEIATFLTNLAAASDPFQFAARNLDALAKKIAELQEPVLELFDAADGVLASLERVGVDEQGLYLTAEKITGLADADHSWSFSADNVRPDVVEDGGTAAIVWCRDPSRSQHDSDVSRDAGVVFRGSLDDLSEVTGEANGFALTVLMLEEDDDKLLQALNLVQTYTEDREVTVAGVDVNVVLDALQLIAQRVGEDDIELKAIDVRFLAGEALGTSSSAQELFRLKPCTILIGRNLQELGGEGPGEFAEFGALAMLEIRRSVTL